ncbi:MAG: DNA primase [Nitrosomonas sp.]|nr:DNA primase [Nitrosomonas sp.]
MISQSFIQVLLKRIVIVYIIEQIIQLKKSCSYYVACCPFHNEKTPSFSVNQSKQFYHCFGCGKHGNAINFLIEFSGISFVDAVENLAAQAGLPIPHKTVVTPVAERSGFRLGADAAKIDNQEAIEKEQNNQVTRCMIDQLQRATDYYREQLKHATKAILYLKQRGLSGELAARFKIGYAPDGLRNLSQVFTDYDRDESENLLLRNGLIIKSNNGKYYDRFRARIIFPILNQKGQIVGFGGRVIDAKAEPKYLNSPETSLFIKSRELYNLFSARKAIRESGRVLVVEGYMDVVMLSQYGIEYAVATLGTATTPSHIQKLLRQTDEIIFSFDGDNAGKKAAWRALETSLAHLKDGKKISFLFLPEGDDPDSFIRQFGKQSFESLFENAIPLSDLLISGLSSRVNLQSSEGRAALIQIAKPLVQLISAPILKLILVKRLSQLTGINQEALIKIFENKLKNANSQSSKQTENLRLQPISPYHKLIKILLYDPCFVYKLDGDLSFLHNGQPQQAVRALEALVRFYKSLSPPELEAQKIPETLLYFSETIHAEELNKTTELRLGWENEIDLEAEFIGLLSRIKDMQRKERMTVLQNKPLNLLTEQEKRELQQLANSF